MHCRSLVILTACGGLAATASGCTIATSRLEVHPGSTNPAPTMPMAAAREVIEATLAPVPQRGAPPPKAVASGLVSLRIRPDDSIEYRLRVDNPGRTRFVWAHLYRGLPGVLPEPVGTLFVNASMSSPFLEVRGTVEGSRWLDVKGLANELRSNPGNFYAVLGAGSDFGQHLRGQFQ